MLSCFEQRRAFVAMSHRCRTRGRPLISIEKKNVGTALVNIRKEDGNYEEGGNTSSKVLEVSSSNVLVKYSARHPAFVLEVQAQCKVPPYQEQDGLNSIPVLFQHVARSEHVSTTQKDRELYIYMYTIERESNTSHCEEVDNLLQSCKRQRAPGRGIGQEGFKIDDGGGIWMVSERGF